MKFFEQIQTTASDLIATLPVRAALQAAALPTSVMLSAAVLTKAVTYVSGCDDVDYTTLWDTGIEASTVTIGLVATAWALKAANNECTPQKRLLTIAGVISFNLMILKGIIDTGAIDCIDEIDTDYTDRPSLRGG